MGTGKDKAGRILSIYSELMNGHIINKAEKAAVYGVTKRSIQRDIDDIRDFLDQEAVEQGIRNEVIYDREKKGYRLDRIYKMKLSNSEILAICKILLDSRSLKKKEMQSMLRRLVACCVPEANRKLVNDLIANESYHYIEPLHGKSFLNDMWEIGQAVQQNKYIEIRYQGMKGCAKTRKLRPLAVMFSEYYFYLAAFIEDDEVRANFRVANDVFPTIYRIDRIQSLKVLDEKYSIPYADRFEEGEFRKRIQFMYGGKLRRVVFEYSGYSVEAVLDRLPTAKIIAEDSGKYTIQAEVFGDGIDMWLRSQGSMVKVME